MTRDYWDRTEKVLTDRETNKKYSHTPRFEGEMLGMKTQFNSDKYQRDKEIQDLKGTHVSSLIRVSKEATQAEKDKFLKILKQLSIDVKDDVARCYVEDAIKELALNSNKAQEGEK